MASIPAFVGVPKRATCNRCSNPIFLAERISFGEKSYHRSCLKCARCGTQLTVGSFYETETDGEYCCETCPDEELQLAKRRKSSDSSESSTHSSIGDGPVAVPVVRTGVRSSKLLDRISFFESAPLSDEEKTSNLERKTRMSSFLKQTLGDDEQEEQDKPPDLPATPPPKQIVIDKQPISPASAEPEEPAVDVEDEFEKLVRDLDDTADREDISEKSISNELGLENVTTAARNNTQDPSTVYESKDHSSEEIQPSETIEESLTEATNVVLVPADIRTPPVAFEELPETEKLKDSSLESDETLDDKRNTNTVNNQATEISLETVKDDRECTEAIIEEEKQASPPVLEPVPASVTESIVPEEKESTDANLLPSQESVTSTEPKDSSNEPIASKAQELPDDSVSNTDVKQVPEERETSSELKLEAVEEPVESTKPESEVPKDDQSVKPTVVIESKEQTEEDKKSPLVQSSTADEEQYPSDLNPFGNDDEEDENASNRKLTVVQNTTPSKPVPTARHISTNPFGSDDDDDDTPQSPSSKPPRPPPPKVKPTASSAVPANPFGEEDDDEQDEPVIVPVVSKPSPRRTPVPTPRKAHAYNDSVSSLDNSLMSSSRLSSSNVSLASSLESGPSSMVVPRRKKGKAPDVPVPPGVGTSSPKPALVVVPSGADKTSTENLSNSSGSGTLTTPRKKRPAPAPPPSSAPTSSSTPKQPSPGTLGVSATSESGGLTRAPSQRLLTLDASLMVDEHDPSDPVSRAPSNESVVYRRTIVPLVLDEDASSESPVHNAVTSSERQWEKMKDNKEAQNRNRQSQSSPVSEGSSGGGNGYGSLTILANKSSQGKWKRRKGPAPALPMLIAAPLPERKPIKMLPLKEIHQELQIIETQQQGLEKQGIVLEKMIRERCEGVDADVDLDIRLQTNSKEVEDLIMQLFELVNEKNELFRRQAELMYLRRMHRLEQEQADLEYEIRLLMAQPERNKTDSDKEKEEALIARLVEIVQLRNEVVECLEMDRIREAEEDLSIKQSIEERAASQQSKHGSSKKESSANTSSTLPLTDAEKRDSSTKLSKKEKKKLKEAKKLSKSKKIDSEKDADETESCAIKEKKKKRKFLF